MILPVSIADWPEYWRELYEERAALMEFEGNIPRSLAESRAATEIRRKHEKESSHESNRTASLRPMHDQAK